MYADVESRGGILEPPGICEVKFRAADQIAKMHEVMTNCDARVVIRRSIDRFYWCFKERS